MKTKLVKSLVAGVAGTALSGVSLCGMNPIGMAAFGAIAGSHLFTAPAIPLYLAAMYYLYGLAGDFKYAMVMFLSGTFILCMKYMEKGVDKVNVYISSMATAISFGLLESADIFMVRRSGTSYLITGISTLLVFSLTVVFGKLIEIFLGEDRIRYDARAKKRGEYKNQTEKIAGNYEEKIKYMAEAFEKMSKSIAGFEGKREGNLCLSTEAGVINEIWKNRLQESRNAVAMQLKEMSGILKDVTSDSYVFANIDEEKERELRKKLRREGVIVKNIVILNNRKGIDEVNIILKAPKKAVPLKNVGEIISDVIGKNVNFRKNPYSTVEKEYTTYAFVEEPNFYILHGTAKRSRLEKDISGDNFTCMELDSGQTLLSVSDGMGHGMKACQESEAVLELLEEMMHSGFSEETAIKLINSVFIVDSDVTSPAALDLGVINMYSGVCDFMKLGAASTFVKRGNWVEAIKSTSLPIGSSKSVDIETTSKKLYDGDFVIMMSDGIIESIKEDDKEKTISDIILEIDEGKPEEMAKEILNRALTHSSKEKDDDMIVLVTGIWDKCA